MLNGLGLNCRKCVLAQAPVYNLVFWKWCSLYLYSVTNREMRKESKIKSMSHAKVFEIKFFFPCLILYF